MFVVDPNITDLQVKEKVISKAYFSMNSPQIATPELSVEEARCYILLFRTGNSYSAYIGLYLPNSERSFYYTFSGNPIPEEGLNEALDEATRFAEEMGFLLDELKLAGMSVDERNQWIEDQAIFGYRGKADDKAGEKPAEKTEAKLVEKTAEKAEVNPALQPAAVEQPPRMIEPQTVPEEPKAVQKPEPQPEVAPSLEERPAMELPETPSVPPAKVAPPAPETPAPRIAAPPKQQPASAQRKPQAQPEAAAARVPQDQEEPAQPAARPAPVKPQKPRARKTVQSTTGTVNREYEALARLLASF
jgi:hypothetical protein